MSSGVRWNVSRLRARGGSYATRSRWITTQIIRPGTVSGNIGFSFTIASDNTYLRKAQKHVLGDTMIVGTSLNQFIARDVLSICLLLIYIFNPGIHSIRILYRLPTVISVVAHLLYYIISAQWHRQFSLGGTESRPRYASLSLFLCLFSLWENVLRNPR